MLYEADFYFGDANHCDVNIKLARRRWGFMPSWFFPKWEGVACAWVERPKTTWGDYVDDDAFAVTINRQMIKLLKTVDHVLRLLED
jgi:hypothetical protein